MLRRMKMANLVVITFAVTAPLVHVLNLSDQFSMNAELWFDLQCLLYRGWGMLFELVVAFVLLTSLAFIYWRRSNTKALRASLLASCFYAIMLVVYFVFNMPGNTVFSGDFSDMRPVDWEAASQYWEMSHALALGLAIVGWLALLRASFWDRKPV